MDEQQVARLLREETERLGLDSRALARRLDATVREVEAVLAGAAGVSFECVLHVAGALGLEVSLHPAKPALRHVGPVPSVVDEAVRRVAPHLVAMDSDEPTRAPASETTPTAGDAGDGGTQ